MTGQQGCRDLVCGQRRGRSYSGRGMVRRSSRGLVQQFEEGECRWFDMWNSEQATVSGMSSPGSESFPNQNLTTNFQGHSQYRAIITPCLFG